MVPALEGVYNRGVPPRAVVVALWALVAPGCGLIADFPAVPAQRASVAAFVPEFGTAGDAPAPIGAATVSFEVRDASERWLVLLSGLVSSPLVGGDAPTPTTAEIAYAVNGAEQGVAGAGGWAQLGSFQHFVLITGVTGTQTVEVTLRSTTPGTAASVRDLSIVAARLPPGARVYFEELREPAVVMEGTFDLLEYLEVPADVTGRLLVLAVVNASDEPGWNGVGVRIARPGGVFMPETSDYPLLHEHFRNPDPTPRSLFAAWVEDDVGGERRFEAEARAGSSEGATVSLVRLLAIPMDDLRSIDWNIQDHAVQSNSPERETLSELTVEAAESPPYLVVQTVVLGDHIPSVSFFGPHDINDSDISFLDADYTLSFGAFSLQESAGRIDLETIFHCSTGGPWCNARAAASFVIGL
jgi:hypothetical protein